jgi:hypothetical protein
MKNIMAVRPWQMFAELACRRRKGELFVLISAKDLGQMIAFHGISHGLVLKADVGVRVKRTQAANLSSHRNHFPDSRIIFKSTFG